MSRSIIKDRFSLLREDINILRLHWGIGKSADAQIS